VSNKEEQLIYIRKIPKSNQTLW